MNYQIIGFTLSLVFLTVGFFELIPALLDYHDGSPNAGVFFLNSFICIFIGFVLILSFKNLTKSMSAREAFLLTTLSWISMTMSSAMPLYMADINISFTDAYFEAVSGYTTTGSTVLSGLDNMSRGVLLWRSLMQWIGGIGIVGFAILFMPFLRIGGMQLFQTESSDKSEKITPKTSDFIINLIAVYLILSISCAVTYNILGMSVFDAIAHSMSTVSTAGFSTHDKSFGHFNSLSLQWAGAFFMFASALPFILYVKWLYKGEFAFFKDDQFKAFSLMLCSITGVLSLWVWHRTDYTFFESLTYATFNITSVITTTGYASTDYIQWGSFASLIFLFTTYLGGCAGSTAGGLKAMRIVIIFKVLKEYINTLIYPNKAVSIYYQDRFLLPQDIMSVLCFSALYVTCNAFIALGLIMTGVDFETALSGAATTMANAGNGTGTIIGPAGNFSSLPDTAKWLLTLSMLLGRLEILTILVLFSSHYWRR